MTLTRRLLLLALISVLPALVIWAFTEVSLRRAREAEINDLVIRQAELAASEVDHIFEGINGLLLAMDEAPAIRSFDAPACNAYLHSVQQKVLHIVSFVVLDLNGKVHCNDRGFINSDLRFKDRPYFQDTITRKGFSIGTYTQEFTEGGLGAYSVLPLSLPIWSNDRQVVGVIVAALDLNWLDKELKERVIPTGGSLTISDRNGVIISREPFPERFIGTRIPDPFLPMLTADRPGSFKTNSQDGTNRIYGYIPVNYPPADNIYVSAGLSTKVAFATINEAAKRGFMLIAAALVLALSLSWLASRAFITKPFEIMTNAVGDWRRGDYQARIDLPKNSGELGLLSKAFNDLMDDVAERQEALKASEERARLALEAGHMGTWWYDHRKGIGGWSSQAAQILGLPPTKSTTNVQEWRSLLHPDDAHHAVEKLRAAVLNEGNGNYEDEYRVRRPDGKIRWINSKGKVSFDARKKPIFFVGIIQDITERRQIEEQQRFFLDELNHRVKNTLATVQSIAAQTLRSSTGSAQFKEAFEGRLLALSMTHNLLTLKSWREADLHDIAAQELAPYMREADERVVIDGPRVNLPSRYAINFGLVLHELVTNAAKYGALSVPTGRLHLAWEVIAPEDAPPQLRLSWKESGGPPVQPPKRQGFGSRLIRRSIEGELDGNITIDFDASGVSYDLSVPLPSA
ncbi:sensor histidine kinase [Microvirga guangxiensis]|uniref:Blue-light-activated histidine kinase n=1 Tax=Microvirga guangxiensis TaxID=549386 RepID=A0A1G5BIE1_9HYPH|nr:HWE histidine kinase domain-containing protein [Microvirga guangxiensis]SCX89915.1 PAS domain S-box-containing protein [Microvirga guangxiensis]